MELRTQRLLLRPFQAGDHAAVHAFAADPQVVRWMDWGPNTPEETSIFLGISLQSENETPRTHYRFAVVRSADNALIGSAELHVESPEHRRGAMGYLIATPAQGQGFATEAARAVLTFGFEQAGLHRIAATCDPENAGSARVLEKIGMRREGHLRDYFRIRGEWRDRLTYAAISPAREPGQ
jgi:[ribosomal protein S5]-alanine N-acetyltransferase